MNCTACDFKVTSRTTGCRSDDPMHITYCPVFGTTQISKQKELENSMSKDLVTIATLHLPMTTYQFGRISKALSEEFRECHIQATETGDRPSVRVDKADWERAPYTVVDSLRENLRTQLRTMAPDMDGLIVQALEELTADITHGPEWRRR